MKKIIFSILVLTLIISGIGFGLRDATVNADDTIVIGEPDWPGIEAKNAVVRFILENIGYDVETTFARDAIILDSLSRGDVDIYMGAWLPQVLERRRDYVGEFDYVTQNMTDGYYTMAVPEYVSEEGVTSLADLDQYADHFDKKLYVGVAGWGTEVAMTEAVENDIYNLGDWEVITSSQSALITEVESAFEENEWIVFAGWEPHWMNEVFEMEYLDDPESLNISPYSWVDTLARPGLQDDHPDLYRFLQQFHINAETQQEWIYELAYRDRDAEEVAEEWVRENITAVWPWLSLIEIDDEAVYNILRKNLELEPIDIN